MLAVTDMDGADLAARDNAAFSELVKVAQEALKTKAVAKA